MLLALVTLAACGENTVTPPPVTPTVVVLPGTPRFTPSPTSIGTGGAGVSLDIAYPNVARRTDLKYEDIFPGVPGRDVSFFQAFVTDDPVEQVQGYYAAQLKKLGFALAEGPTEIIAKRASTIVQMSIFSRDQPAAQKETLKSGQSLVAILVRDGSSNSILGPRATPTK